MGYLVFGFILWLFINSTGAGLGPEYILTLPAMLGFLFLIGIMFL